MMRCEECGVERRILMPRLDPADLSRTKIVRLCEVCTELFSAVAGRNFFVKQQIAWKQENAVRILNKRQILDGFR